MKKEKEEVIFKYIVHEGLVKTCVELRFNPLIGKTEVGLRPFFFGDKKQNIGVKETIFVNCEEIFDTEEEAEMFLLKKKTKELSAGVGECYDFLKEEEKKTKQLIYYILALSVINFLGFVYLTAVIK